MKSVKEVLEAAFDRGDPNDCPISDALCAITSLEAAGYVIVPKEPTLEMIERGLEQWSNMRDMYCAMVAAAPIEANG
jgi:hypothetical protein